jgi:drug/metabolite transporter (DMT)-like permease
MTSEHDPRLRRFAKLAMLGSVAIYGANFVISRHAVLNGFTPYDLAALRFATAGFILLPLFVKAGGLRDCAGVGWGRGLILALMSGAPMTMLMLTALALAPAAHGATIGPGTVACMSLVGGALMFGTRPGGMALAGFGIVLLGLICFAIGSGLAPSRYILIGDAMFFLMALLWGGYPLVIQKWRVDPLVATAVLSVLSLAYLPIYWFFLPGNLAGIPLWVVVAHAFNQGVLNVIAGLWLWGFAARTIGAAEAGRFPPLIPVIGTLTAIPVLGEWPGPFQTVAVILIVAGLLVMTRRAA